MSLTRIGRYELNGEVGRGAMGIVYRGFDPMLGRAVAIKTVTKHFGDEEFLKRLRMEAHAAARLSHPNIITVHDAGEDQGHFYIAMELVEGQTLQNLLVSGPLVVSQAVSIACQVASALDHAHSQGIIHRDIKPANIMVAAGVAKVMDFGVAKVGTTGLTSTGQLFGTPSYMSPELVKGVKIDGRSDIFSLGVVAYEMLTGVKPFQGDNITTVIYKIVEENLIPPATMNPELDPAFNLVLGRALAKEPADRYSGGAEFADALRRAAGLSGSEPGVAASAAAGGAATATAATVSLDRREVTPVPRSASTRRAPVPMARKRNYLLAAVAVALAVVATAGTLVYRWRHNAAPPEQVSVQIPAGPVPALSSQPGAAGTGQHPGVKPSAFGEAGAAAQPAGTPPPGAAQPAPAPPASDARGSTGSVRVRANVRRALIAIDGKDTPYRTPRTLHLAPGKHFIQVSQPGYKALGANVDIAQGVNKPLEFNLRQLLSVDLTSDPPGAEILIDGEKYAQATPTKLIFEDGDHRITVRKPGYQPWEHVVKEGGLVPARFQVKLSAQPQSQVAVTPPKPAPAPAAPAASRPAGIGRITLHSQPRGASIIIDGTKTDYTTPVNIPLTAGKHTIVLEHRGFDPVRREVVIKHGQFSEVQVEMRRNGERRRLLPLP